MASVCVAAGLGVVVQCGAGDGDSTFRGCCLRYRVMAGTSGAVLCEFDGGGRVLGMVLSRQFGSA